jgi:hypothetical protein
LRIALAALTTANQIVKPWDYSIAVINGYLQSTRFCHQQLAGRPDQVPQLRAFIDRILTLNASRWRSGQNFMDAAAIASIWQNWIPQLPPIQPPRLSSFVPPHRRFDWPPYRPNIQYPGAPRNTCRRFNSPTGCPNPGPNCEIGSGPKKFMLQHLCLASVGPNTYCL